MQLKISKLIATAVLGALCAHGATAQEETTPPQTQETETGVQGFTKQGDRASRLNLRLRDRLVRDVVQSIRRQAGVNIVVDAEIEDRVTLDLEDVDWRQALDLVAEAAGCVVVESGTVLKVEKPPRVYFAFDNADV